MDRGCGADLMAVGKTLDPGHQRIFLLVCFFEAGSHAAQSGL